MNISPIYIKMSKQAMKFLPKHSWQPGDFYSYVAGKTKVAVYDGWEYEEGAAEEIDGDSCIPLLRQDQLQAMINLPGPLPNLGIVDQLVVFRNLLLPEAIYYEQFTSFEQIWLAFIMKEKYSKIWNGSDWVTA